MIHAGDILENTRTGSRAVILKTQTETGGSGFQYENFAPPHSGQDLPAHYHLWWDEAFDILAGSCTYQLDGVSRTASAGDSFTLPAGKPHIHPWNTGDVELHFRQTDHFAHPDPQAVIDTLNIVATTYGLAREGKVGSDGKPRPLQLAVMMQTLMTHDAYLAGSPPAAQRMLFSVLGAVGRALGYKPSYPQFTGD